MEDNSDRSGRGAGNGRIEVESFGNSTSKITNLSSAYPLRLISTRASTSNRAALVFVLTYGGGLVAGDKIGLHVEVLPNARLGLLTQGSAKIYKSPSSKVITVQNVNATIRDHGALLVLQDPVQPFKDSVYEQRQIFHMNHNNSSLLLLDWLSEGRSARGENWSFVKWRGLNEVWSLPDQETGSGAERSRLLLRDSIKLERDSSVSSTLQERMGGLGVYGNLVLAGPVFESLGSFFLQKYASRPRIGEKIWSTNEAETQDKARGSEQSYDPGLKWTATSTRGFVVVRFGATAVEHARRWLREMLMEDGTVEREFGRQHLLCLEDR